MLADIKKNINKSIDLWFVHFNMYSISKYQIYDVI